MTTQPEIRKKSFSPRRAGAWVGGLFLIFIGLLILANQLIDIPGFDNLFLPILSLIFIVWGLASREGGLLIPGGILAGISTGIYLMSGPYAHLEEPGQPGVFLIRFGAGWVLITVLSIFTGQIQWWALFPGFILGAIGGGLLAGGIWITVLEWVGKLWPVALILAGVWIVFKRKA